MSTQQQAMIVETVVAIRKALKRKAYDSDSDSSIEHNTNRGYKLKRGARFVRQGRLAPPNGPAAYKEIVEHAGFHRAIINENPPLVDEEGYELDSDDNEERVQEAIAAAQDENPYASIHLEHLLAPLTAVTDLPTHPTLSRPFTSKALTELVKQGCSLMHKENAALWKAKPLLTRLIGDNTWAPCGMMIEPTDLDLFTDSARFLKRPANPSATPAGMVENGDEEHSPSDKSKTNELLLRDTTQADLAQETEARGKGKEDDDGTQSDTHAETNGQPEGEASSSKDKPGEGDQVNGDARAHPAEGTTESDNQADGDITKTNHDPKEDVEMVEAQIDGAPARGEGQNGDGRRSSAGAETPHELFIHPLFLIPRSARPDRDLALPEQEAEDVRRLLQLYVQKQEEVCRGTKKLYEGLLKADRYRRTVWQWSKAEAHCGPNRDMSDGEDWYDKEEWGLTEDLKKGEDEVEEDTTQTQKKTRNRK